jgi:hypothetical protein
MKQLKSFLDENTIYTNPTEKATVLADKEKVMNLFFFNFLMFLGMFKMNDQTAGMKNYETAEGKLQIDNIGDDNHDVSVSVKLAYDSGFITQAVVTRITKLLFLIKSKRLSGKDLDENLIRGIIADIKYKTFRPSQKVLAIVDQFQDGKLDLEHTAKELYLLSKLKPNKDGTLEVRELVMKGKYNTIFGKMGDYVPPSTTTASTDVPSDETKTVPNTPKKKDATTETPSAKPAKAGISLQFLVDLLNTRSSKEYDNVLKTYGVSDSEVSKYGSDKNIATIDSAFEEIKKQYSTSHLPYPLFSRWKVASAFDKLGDYLFSKITNLEFDYIFEDPSNTDQCLDRLNASRSNLASNLSVFSTKRKNEKILAVTSHLSDKILEIFDLIKEENNEKRIYKISVFFYKILVFLYLDFNSVKAEAFTYREPLRKAIASGDESAVRAAIAFMMCSPNITSYALPFSIFDIRLGISDLLNVGVNYLGGTEEQIKITPTDLDRLPESIRRVANMGFPNKIFEIAKIKTPDEVVYDTIKAIALDGQNFDSFTTLLVENSIDLVKFTPSLIEEGVKQAKSNQNIKKQLDWFFNAFQTIDDARRNYSQDTIETLIKIAIEIYKETWNDPNYGPEKMATMFLIDRETVDEIIKIGFSDALLKYLVRTINQPPQFTIDAIFEYIVDHKVPAEYNLFANGSFDDIVAQHQKETPLPDNSNEAIRIFEYLLKQVNTLTKFNEYIDRLVAGFPELKKNAITEIATAINSGKLDTIVQLIPKIRLFDTDIQTPDLIAKFKKIAEDEIKSKDFSKNVIFTRLKDLPEDLKTKISGDIFNSVMKDPKMNINHLKVAVSLFSPVQLNKYAEASTIEKNSDSIIEITPLLANTVDLLLKDNNYKIVSAKTLGNLMNFSTSTNEKFKKVNPELRAENDRNIGSLLDKVMIENRDDVLEDVFQNSDSNIRQFIIEHLKKIEFVSNAVKRINNDVIKPLVRLDNNSLLKVLEYNNITTPEVTDANAKSYKTAKEFVISKAAEFQDLKVAKVDNTEEELDRLTIEYNKFNKYKHGKIGVKFLEEFNVDIEVQNQGQQEFLEYMPATKVLDPVFHGTGSVAASMILRFGFAIITGSGGPVKTIGKMLGDGIYFSNVLDKVAQYAGDEGYTRGTGTVGYIFQMHALLGEEGKDYLAAGLGGDNIISPEWCVFSPNKQLKIYKAFKIEIVYKNDIDEIKQKYKNKKIKEDENVMKIKSFREFIKEADGDYTNATTYIFMDGYIPINKTETVSSLDFNPSKFGDRVRIEPGQIGPMVIISHNHPESESFCVSSTFRFMRNDAEITKFLDLLNGQ